MSELNGLVRRHPTRMITCEPNASHSVFDNNISEYNGDNTNPRRVMVVAAAAGALTAAMILAGWGMKIERNEAQILRAGLSVPTARSSGRFSYFQPIGDDRNQVVTAATSSSSEDDNNDEAQNNEEHAEQTIRVERLKLLNDHLRKYARKRAKLRRIMLKLRAFEVKLKNRIRNSKAETVIAGAQLSEEAQYRTQLREAAELRDELRQLRSESSATSSYANRSQYQFQSTASSSLHSELWGNETPQLNDNIIPHDYILLKDNMSSQSSAGEPIRLDLRNMTINKRAQYHTSRLIARLEETRLDVTTRLTAVTLSDNQPVR